MQLILLLLLLTLLIGNCLCVIENNNELKKDHYELQRNPHNEIAQNSDRFERLRNGLKKLPKVDVKQVVGKKVQDANDDSISTEESSNNDAMDRNLMKNISSDFSKIKFSKARTKATTHIDISKKIEEQKRLEMLKSKPKQSKMIKQIYSNSKSTDPITKKKIQPNPITENMEPINENIESTPISENIEPINENIESTPISENIEPINENTDPITEKKIQPNPITENIEPHNSENIEPHNSENIELINENIESTPISENIEPINENIDPITKIIDPPITEIDSTVVPVVKNYLSLYNHSEKTKPTSKNTENIERINKNISPITKNIDPTDERIDLINKKSRQTSKQNEQMTQKNGAKKHEASTSSPRKRGRPIRKHVINDKKSIIELEEIESKQKHSDSDIYTIVKRMRKDKNYEVGKILGMSVYGQERVYFVDWKEHKNEECWIFSEWMNAQELVASFVEECSIASTLSAFSGDAVPGHIAKILQDNAQCLNAMKAVGKCPEKMKKTESIVFTASITPTQKEKANNTLDEFLKKEAFEVVVKENVSARSG